MGIPSENTDLMFVNCHLPSERYISSMGAWLIVRCSQGQHTHTQRPPPLQFLLLLPPGLVPLPSLKVCPSYLQPYRHSIRRSLPLRVRGSQQGDLGKTAYKETCFKDAMSYQSNENLRIQGKEKIPERSLSLGALFFMG